MTHFFKLTICGGVLLLCSIARLYAQTKPVKTSIFDGIIVAGYADDGMYINCTGPAVKFSKKPFAIMAGLLPSLKIKEDKSLTTKNAIITPTLGFGITALYKHLALQLPIFYATKTSAQNGGWKIGIGLGYKF